MEKEINMTNVYRTTATIYIYLSASITKRKMVDKYQVMEKKPKYIC